MQQILANKKLRNDKLIFIFSIIVFLYIAFMILSYRLGFDGLVIIGFFRELLDIPALALIPVLFILSSISFIKEKLKLSSYPFYSILILLVAIAGLIVFV